MIHFSHVYKTFQEGTHALRDVNLSISKGEFVFLTGHSGAGKTTLFNLLSGFDRASSGEIKVSDFRVGELGGHQLPEFRRRVGVVFQDFKLLVNRTVVENIALPLEIRFEKESSVQRKVNKMLDSLGLSLKGHLYPDQLSGGEKQRVAIGRALIPEPDLIVADEPTGNLDPDLSRDVIEVFQQFNANGTTVFIATHDHDLVKSLKKRVVHLKHGELSDKAFV